MYYAFIYWRSYLEMGEDPEGAGAKGSPKDDSDLKRWLSVIDCVTITTERVGTGNGARFRFKSGEIRLADAVGLKDVRENPHFTG
jgi:hypothetical protein